MTAGDPAGAPPRDGRAPDAPRALADADAALGRPFPVPTVALPLARWVEVRTLGTTGAQVEWNLDDSRPGSPGRLTLYAGTAAPPPQLPAGSPGAEVTRAQVGGHDMRITRVALDEAQPSLRPVVEVAWRAGDLHLRLTTQGPWALPDVLQIAASVRPTGLDALG